MNQEIGKALIVCLFFVSLFLIMPNWIGGSPDYSEHFSMALERYHGTIDERNKEYAPLLQHLLAIFSVRERYFQFATMLLILLITPLLLVLITRSWLAALFYFMTSSYLFFMTGGLFAQALLGIFMLGLFATQNNYLRILILIVGSISHSIAPITLIGTFLLLLLYESKWNWNDFFPKQKMALAGFCSPVWGKTVPSTVTTKISYLSGGTEALSLNDILSFVTKIAPFPFLWVAIKTFLDKKEWHFMVLLFVCMIGAYFFNARMIYFGGLICVIGFTKGFASLQYQRAWWFLVFMNGIVLFAQHYLLVNKIFC